MASMVDMELDDEDKLDMCTPVAGKVMQPDYPWGLRINLGDSELKKLDIDDLPSVGDYIDLRAFARVTSVSANEVEGGKSCRVELQIEKLGVVDG